MRWWRGARWSKPPLKARLNLKVTGLLLLVGILPLLTGGLVSLSLLRASLRSSAEENLRTLAGRASIEVASIIEQGYTHIEGLAENPIIASPETDLSLKLAEMEKAQNLYQLFEDVTLIDIEGNVLKSTTYSYRGEWKTKEWFLQALQGEIAVSDAHIIPDPFKVVVVYVAPLKDSSGELWGAVAGQVNMERVWQITDSIHPGKTGFTFLLNSRGRFLAHPDRRRLLDLWEGADRIMKLPSGITTAPGKDSTLLVAFSQVVPGTLDSRHGWKLAMAQSTAEAYHAAATTQRILMEVLLLAVVLIFFISLFFSRRLLKPLRALIDGTRRVARGDFGHRVPVSTNDEIGELTSSFNTMAQELQDKIKGLEESRRRIVTTQESLRKEIAARLHGPVQTKLWVLWKRLEDCQTSLSTPEEASRILEEVRRELDDLREKDVREISHSLHPAIIEVGLPAALRSLRDRFEGVVDIDLEIGEEVVLLEESGGPGLAADARLALYRCAQEALNNVVKHSRASKVKMSLGKIGSELLLTVVDNGVGFRWEEIKRGLGITSMYDYMGALRGSCLIETAPGKGTMVTATLPLDA